MLEWFGIEADETDLALVPPGPPVEREPDLTVIHPGAADGARRWPPERFAAVALAEKCGGRRVAVTGSADERSLTRRVVAQAGLTPASNLAGTLDVIGLSRLVARAGVVVCGDTGLAHLATATATPSVVLFGPVDPARWGPPPVDRHRPLWAGRCGDPHGALPFEGLLALEVREVLHAIDEARAATPES
jgi:ADP-heptose:LPS heptosyltransferase